MPCVNDDRPKGLGWPAWLGIGCGGCIFVIIILFLGGFFVARRAVKQAMTMTTPPPVHGPYSFQRPSAANCTIPLPDGSGSVEYMQELNTFGSSGPGGPSFHIPEDRAVRIQTKAFKGLECPLPSYEPDKVKVDVFWYPAANGTGSCLRLWNPAEDKKSTSPSEELIDLSRGISLKLIRVDKEVFIGEYNPNGESWSSESGPGGASVTYNGKPAKNVAATFGKNKGKYLGTITRSGSTLKFTKAQP